MRTVDVQGMLRVVGGAAELWYQPSLQRQFTLDSLCRLLDARVGICFTMGDVLRGGTTPCTQVAHVGLNESGVALLEEYLKSGKPRDPVIDVLSAVQGRVITFARREAVADGDWFASDHYRKFRKPLGLGPSLYVKIVAPSIGRETLVMLLREKGAEAFTDRETYLTDLCLSEMAWPFTAEMTYVDPQVERLQPRLKKVMKCLLEGDSEKQVAYKLKLSPHTVHEYVKDLYSELGVNSRGELLAQFVGKL
ncbi:MAG: helix-turn-helix transcriptional regulator [Tepidisphaeraceae bacterium]